MCGVDPCPQDVCVWIPRTGEYIRLHGQKGVKTTEGIELANKLALKLKIILYYLYGSNVITKMERGREYQSDTIWARLDLLLLT